MKKIVWLFMVIVMILCFSSAMADANFIEVENVNDIEGSRFFLYQPSELYNPPPMMTPVIYVFPDQAYANQDEAYAALQAAGLIEIAEKEFAVIVAVNPLGETWTKADVDVFEAIEVDIYYSRGASAHGVTYQNLQYVIGEGSGATFINQYLSQDCKRIAGALTFGGEYKFAYQLYYLPAYIVSGNEGAIEFFKGTNKVDAEKAQDGKTIYYNSINPLQQVVVSNAEAVSLDADIIADCWNTMFRYTTRLSLNTSIYDFPYPKYNTADYTLMARPNYEAAGMKLIKHGGNPLWENDASAWFEFIPAAAQNPAEGETFPLLLILHGAGDHPIFEAESNGWAQLAIDHNLIVVSPSAPAFFMSDTDQTAIFGLIDYMIETYPVDVSRIYAAGFSMGGLNTGTLINTRPELFAAAAGMAAPFGNAITLDPAAYDYDIDMPFCILGNQFDEHSSDSGVLTNCYKFSENFNSFAALNEVPLYEGEIDTEKYPFWGIPFEDTARIRNKTGFAHNVGCWYDEAGVPMVYSVWAEGLTHSHFVENAEVIWRWMKNFSRDLDTKAVVYTPAE